MADTAKPQQHSPAKREAILVLGMHLSGTSALTGVIGGLGVATPKTPAPANEWNARGYFESPSVANNVRWWLTSKQHLPAADLCS